MAAHHGGMPRSQGDTPRPLLARDAGLRRVSRLSRWLAAAGIVLTGLISKVAAQSFSGHTARAAAPAKRSAPATPAPAPDDSSTPSDSSSAGSPPDGSSSSGGSSSGGSSSDGAVPSDPSAQDPSLQAPSEVPQPSSSSDGAVSGGS